MFPHREIGAFPEPSCPDGVTFEHQVWRLDKPGHSMLGVVRVSRGGYELRVVADGDRRWTSVYPPGAEDLLGEAVDRKRRELEADGWLDASFTEESASC